MERGPDQWCRHLPSPIFSSYFVSTSISISSRGNGYVSHVFTFASVIDPDGRHGYADLSIRDAQMSFHTQPIGYGAMTRRGVKGWMRRSFRIASALIRVKLLGIAGASAAINRRWTRSDRGRNLTDARSVSICRWMKAAIALGAYFAMVSFGAVRATSHGAIERLDAPCMFFARFGLAPHRWPSEQG